jgi:hypothetical protein
MGEVETPGDDGEVEFGKTLERSSKGDDSITIEASLVLPGEAMGGFNSPLDGRPTLRAKLCFLSRFFGAVNLNFLRPIKKKSITEKLIKTRP